jgi:hypothetical protein
MHGEVARLAGEEARVDGDEFGEGSLKTADSADHAVDFVAGAEGGDVRCGLFNGASHVYAEYGGEGLAGVCGFGGADLGVERVDSAGGDADEDLAGTEDGAGNLALNEVSTGLFNEPCVGQGFLRESRLGLQRFLDGYFFSEAVAITTSSLACR